MAPFPGGYRFPAEPRSAVTIPSRIDATTAPGDYVDITFDWMPGVPSTLRIPRASAIALGSDLLGLGASTRSTVVPGPRSGTRNPLFLGHSLETSTPIPPIGGIPPRAPAVAPPADWRSGTRPGGPPLPPSPPQRRHDRRAGLFAIPNLFAWGLIAALLIAAFVLWATGAGHVGD